MNITLTLTIDQVNMILRCLDQAPHAQVRQLFDYIIAEASAQQQKAAQPVTVEVKE